MNEVQVREMRVAVVVAVACFILLELNAFKDSVVQSISEGHVSRMQVNTVLCKSASSLA